MGKKITAFAFISAVVSLVMIFTGAVIMKYQREQMMQDLRSKAAEVAGSVGVSLALISEHPEKKAWELISEFEKEKRTQGCIIYDKSGAVLAESGRFRELYEGDKAWIKDVMKRKSPEFLTDKVGYYHVLRYLMPVVESNRAIGGVEVIYDVSYIYSRIREDWRRLEIIAVFFIALLSFIIFDIIEKRMILPGRKAREMKNRLKISRVKKYSDGKIYGIKTDLDDTGDEGIYRDKMTGIMNYRYYTDIIAPVLNEERNFCLALIDIDNFREFREKYGVKAADSAVQAVADILSQYTDRACRYGGEEFIFALRSDKENFTEICSGIKDEIYAAGIRPVHDGPEAGVTGKISVSIGIACSEEADPVYADEKERTMFRLADKRLFKAKLEGKNRAVSD